MFQVLYSFSQFVIMSQVNSEVFYDADSCENQPRKFVFVEAFDKDSCFLMEVNVCFVFSIDIYNPLDIDYHKYKPFKELKNRALIFKLFMVLSVDDLK